MAKKKPTPKNEHAAALGRLGKGKLKKLSKAERLRRAESVAIARAKRWPKKIDEEDEE